MNLELSSLVEKRGGKSDKFEEDLERFRNLKIEGCKISTIIDK